MRKPSNNQILAKVRQLIDKMAVAHEQQSFQTKKKEMSRVMEQIDQFDRSRGPGLKVGRLVSWPQGLVRLAWLPWWDSWQSPAVVDGHALRPAVEPAVRSRDGRRKLFGNRSAKAEKPNT